MIVGIVGQKRAGKDTAAKALTGFVNLKMADPLKEMLRVLYRMAGYQETIIERKIDGDLKEVPCDLLGGKTPRHAMQTLGTEWRDMIHRDLWLTIWESRAVLLQCAGKDVVCTDIRFHHEADRLRELGGELIRVVRPGQANTDLHPSEKDIPEIAVNAELVNDSTPEALHEKLHDYFRQNH